MAATKDFASPPLRVGTLLKNRHTLAQLTAVATVVVGLMTLLYFGSIVDPSAHLSGLPVAVVNQDAGATTSTGTVDIGHQVVADLTGNSQITSRLAITVESVSVPTTRWTGVLPTPPSSSRRDSRRRSSPSPTVTIRRLSPP